MIVVVGRVTSDAEKRDELIRIAATVAAATRNESGCRGYNFCADTENPNDFFFVEQWDDMDSLKAHFGTSHVAEFMQAVPATLVAPPDIQFHTVESTMDIAQMTGG